MSWSVERWWTACSAVVPPVSWTVGSSDPPLRITFLGGGQGGKAVEPASGDPAFVELAFAEPALVDPAPLDPAPVAFAASGELLTAGFRAVGAVEQLDGTVFL